MGGLRHYLKKATRKVAHAVGMNSHDLSMIALSPFTAGASLMGTSSAKAMLKNPMGTLTGALTGAENSLESGQPLALGAFLGALQGGGGFDAMFSNGISNGTSAKSAANDAIGQQYRYNLMLQQQNQQWQTAMANTAHQREVADLKASGLNPVLSSGGSGAPIGSPGGGSVGMPDTVGEKTAEMQNAIAKGTLMNEILNGISQRQLNSAGAANQQAQAFNTIASTEPNIAKTLAERAYYIEAAQQARSNKEVNEAEKGLKNWNSRHPVLANFLSGGIGAMASIGGAAITAGAIKGKGTGKSVNVVNPTITTTAPVSAKQLLGIY